MDESSRSVNRPHALVEMSARYLQQAIDVLTTSNRTFVMLEIFDGAVVAINTANQSPLLIDAKKKTAIDIEEIAPNRDGRGRRKRWSSDAINRDLIFKTIAESEEPLRTFDISERLEIPFGKLRDKVSRLVMDLVHQKRIALVKTPKGRHYIVADKARHSDDKKHRITRKDVTPEKVIATIRALGGGPVFSKDISDHIGIPINDISVRGKVSETLAMLRNEKRVRIAANKDGITQGKMGSMTRYEIIEEAKPVDVAA